jgi:hypothetical protein
MFIFRIVKISIILPLLKLKILIFLSFQLIITRDSIYKILDIEGRDSNFILKNNGKS